MATRAKSVRAAATKGKTTTAAKRRRSTVSSRKSKNPSLIVNMLVPIVFITAILVCLGFLLLMGYRTVTASSFFNAKAIEVEGNSKVSKDDIERIVRSETEKNGVWNAQLEEIKGDVESLAYVKTAVVSRILPSGVRVQIVERVPRVIVRTNTGDVWVDDDAMILAPVSKNDTRPPFVLRGWDETKSERAQKENQDRVQLFQRIMNEWQDAGLARRVTALNLADPQEAQATVEDSGASVTISLGKEDFERRLRKGLEVVEGKGLSIESVISHTGNIIAKSRGK